MKQILVVGPAWVGDMVMAQALLKVLKEVHQHSVFIDVLAPAWSCSLTARMPEVRAAITMPVGHGVLGLSTRWRLAQSLKASAYDEAYILPNSFKSALIPFWARIPKRIGWFGECRYGLLNQIHRLDRKKYPLMVERFVALAYPVGARLPAVLPFPRLRVDQVSAQQACHKFGLTLDRPIVLLCPGAEFGASKRWPTSSFAQVARHYLLAGAQVWLLGSPKDAEVTHEIQESTSQACIDLAGKTTLAEAIDLISLATLVISNDSGLMHIAAALARPLVVVYGSTDPGFTPPLGEQVRIARVTDLECSPCFKRECPLKHHACMKQLLPETVMQVAAELVSVP